MIKSKLENYVCSLKLAKYLYEIGISQDTYFHWVYDKKNDFWEICWCDDSDFFDKTDLHYAAYTAQDVINIFKEMKFSYTFYVFKDGSNIAEEFASTLYNIHSKLKDIKDAKQ